MCPGDIQLVHCGSTNTYMYMYAHAHAGTCTPEHVINLQQLIRQFPKINKLKWAYNIIIMLTGELSPQPARQCVCVGVLVIMCVCIVSGVNLSDVTGKLNSVTLTQ